jgi:hypothetical protein
MINIVFACKYGKYAVKQSVSIPVNTRRNETREARAANLAATKIICLIMLNLTPELGSLDV